MLAHGQDANTHVNSDDETALHIGTLVHDRPLLWTARTELTINSTPARFGTAARAGQQDALHFLLSKVRANRLYHCARHTLYTFLATGSFH